MAINTSKLNKMTSVIKNDGLKSFGSRALSYMQTMARGMIIPISILAITGLFFGIFLAIDKMAATQFPDFVNSAGHQTVNIFKDLFGLPFTFMAPFFAIAIALTMAKENKAIAALGGLVGYAALLIALGGAGKVLITLSPDFAEDIALTTKGNLNGNFWDTGGSGVLGLTTLRVGVLGGIVAGLLSAAIFNKTQHIHFKGAFAFFGGWKLSMFLIIVGMGLFGILFMLPWVGFMFGLQKMGEGMAAMGVGGAFLYGFSERMLIPTGLHHILNQTFKFTGAVQASAEARAFLDALGVTNGFLVQGESFSDMLTDGTLPLYLSSLTGDGKALFELYHAQGSVSMYQAWLGMSVELKETVLTNQSLALNLTFATGGRKQTFMMIGLPAAALAMYLTSQNKTRAAAILLPAAMTAALTGVTEPMEFSFLFAAPVLYVGHAVLAGLGHVMYSAQAMYFGGAPVGLTMGGVIENIAFGAIQPGAMSGWLYVWGIAFILAPIYFGMFYVYLKYTKQGQLVQTPGRYSAEEIEAVGGNIAALIKADETGVAIKGTKIPAAKVVKGLGGAGNIKSITNCMTRLRVVVKDKEKVNKDLLMETNAAGVKFMGRDGVQVIYGPVVESVAADVKKLLKITD